MNNRRNNNNDVGMGFLGWLQLLFIALKLLGKIDWSWWAVLLPFEIDVIVIIVALVITYFSGR